MYLLISPPSPPSDMSSPPPRPPPPTKHTTPTHKIQNTQSEPQNEDTGSGMQTDQQTCQ